MNSTTFKGRVFLIGGGCGEPDLITLKARRLLEIGDVILYDHLVHPNLLHFAKPEAECISVGKRKGAHSKKQDEINQLMVTLAKQGQMVIRLKGGDPCTFGRGGEEMEYLHDHGVPFEVVPGISSATTAALYAGIPITHRDVSQSFGVVTGSLKEGSPLEQNSIPNVDTLVVLMGVTHRQDIIEKIAGTGYYSPSTPAAFIYNATLSDQKVIKGTLSTICDIATHQRLCPPAVLVVGDVVRLSETLDWASTRILAGKRVILLRTLEQSHEMTALLTVLGAEVVQFPIQHLDPIPGSSAELTPEKIRRNDSVIFSSANAVRFFFEALSKHSGDARDLAGLEIVSVGPKTSGVLNDYGIRADIEAAHHQQEGILEAMSEDLSSKRVLIPSSSKARPYLADTLSKRGAIVTTVPLYTPRASTLTTEPEVRDGDLVVFTSSSTVAHFFETVSSVPNIVAVCLGPVTKSALSARYNGEIRVSRTPCTDDLVAAIVQG